MTMTGIDIYYIAIWFIIGAVIGSFLNVVADRLLRGEQFVKGHSYCEHCKTILKPKDLIPIISFMSTGGKCRYCGVKLSKQYPISEVITAIGTVILAVKLKTDIYEMLIALTLLYTLIVASIMDYKETWVADRIHVVGAGIIFLLRIIQQERLFFALQGMVVSMLFLGLVFAISKGKMGGADIKIYAPIGLVVGMNRGIESLFYASVLSLPILIIYMIIKKKPLKGVEIPFIPFIGLGVFATYFYDYIGQNFII